MPSECRAHSQSNLERDLRAVIRAAVGRIQIRDLEATVRRTMVLEALHRTSGNRRAAARLLGISRQHLQHMLRAIDPRLDPERHLTPLASSETPAATGTDG